MNIINFKCHSILQESMWKDLIENAKSRGRTYDIHSSAIGNAKDLKKRLFTALSPSKSVVDEDQRRRLGL
jgi:hypothetical protein